MKQLHRISRLLMIAITLFIALSAVAYAESEFVSAGTRAVNNPAILFYQSSSSSATGIFEIGAASSEYASSITSKVTLQSAQKGSTNFKNVTGTKAKTYTVTSSKTILHTGSFSINNSLDYRIRVELSDVINGTTTTKTYYCILDR